MEYDKDPSEKLSSDVDSQADSWLTKLGPGLITGAADDDPSGIATYSQAGAQFGFDMLWTVLLTYPLMVAIQVVSARIGRVSGHGLATNLRRHYPRWLLYGTVILLLVANTINIAADLTAMGAAVNLLVGGPTRAYTVGLGVFSLVLQMFVPYRRYVRILKWLTLALFAYVGVIFAVQIPWATVALHTVLPHGSWSTGLHHDGSRRVRHHHQPVSVLLAGVIGGRGTAGEGGTAGADENAVARAGKPEPHPP